MDIDLWEIENEIIKSGLFPLCGVDEAGRGPLAGPVCAAAVILPQGFLPEGLNDSKKLSAKRRDSLFNIICENALSFSVAFADVEEIERLNILGATYLAMNRAIKGLKISPKLCLIDGNRSTGIKHENRCVTGGDGKCASIAAASVLAKVSRDRLMISYDETYPQYGFSQHKGYGTAMHYKALREHGLCPIHRPSFLKKGLHGEDN